MADRVATMETTLPSEDVLVRSVQFFTNQNWRAQSQANRVATFVGAVKLPIMHLILAILLTACFVIPGLLYYFLVIKGMRRMQNIVVTTTPKGEGCEVVVTYPPSAQSLVNTFFSALPKG